MSPESLLLALAVRNGLLPREGATEADLRRLSAAELAALQALAGALAARDGGDQAPTPNHPPLSTTEPTVALPGGRLAVAHLGGPVPFASGPEDRYDLQAEIGRGGLGVVLAARDRAIGRYVALKLVRSDAGGEAVQRFLLEARITGQLEHPNIVPVHDLGHLAGPDGARHAFFCMKYVRGRNLWEVIQSLARGEAEAARRFSRPRLLAIFQDICMGVAFAHDHGVIHRDLKPSNVMIGEYGEVLIVDWGLARVLGAGGGGGGGDAGAPAAAAASVAPPPAGPALPATAADSATPTGLAAPFDPAAAPPPGAARFVPPSDRIEAAPGLLTQAGDVLGTPSYMPPEQAEGRIDELDERSDVYSLGAILYEILTWRPPYQGTSFTEVVVQVRTGKLVPPSVVVREGALRGGVPSTAPASAAAATVLGAEEAAVAAPSAVEASAEPEPAAPVLVVPADPVAPELEAICLRALSRRREERYQSARELFDEVQLYLEGVRERARKQEAAGAKAAEGEVKFAEYSAARAAVASAQAEVEEAAGRLEGWEPLAEKRRLWAAQDRLRALRVEAVTRFAEADACFTEALGQVPEHARARAGKAGLHWERFVQAEAAGAEEEMLRERKQVELYDDGALAAALRGDGRLTVRARAWSCGCLGAGRAHAPECRREPVAGATAVLYRYVEGDRVLVPAPPPGVRGAIGSLPEGEDGEETVGETGADGAAGPALPTPGGRGLLLGRTPTPNVELPLGSYLVVLEHADFATVRVPVRVARRQQVALEVTLYPAAIAPAGFVQVAGGATPLGGDPDAVQPEVRVREIPDFFLLALPVTCDDYLVYLNDLAASDPEQARQRAPRGGGGAGKGGASGGPGVGSTTAAYWKADADGRWRLPTPEEGTLATPAGRLPWDAGWPLVGVSWHDALAYAEWRGRREGKVFTLPTEHQREKATRGVDGRFFPWGNAFDASFCRMALSDRGGARMWPAGAAPVDESPYGARDLAGGVREWCLNEDEEKRFPGWRMMRGGMWNLHAQYCRAAYRAGTPPDRPMDMVGFRLCWNPE